MVITFPNMGNTYLAAKALFDGLCVKYVIPSQNNKEALEIGSSCSPEEICLPFKIMMGNYIQSIKRGADTVIITGSCGPCRFGEYCELQMKILKRLNRNLNFIVLDMPSSIGTDEFLRRGDILLSASSKSKSQKIKALFDAYKVIQLIDKIEAKAHFLSGYESNRGECRKMLMKCKNDAVECNNPGNMIKVLNEYLKAFNNIKINKNKKPIKIAIIGEIYTVIEPFSNLYIEEKLMEYGVSTKRKLTPSWWVNDAILSLTRLNELDIKRASKKYLPLCIGGHARECVGEAVLAEEEKLDGAIQIFPMGCMPEIVSKSILPSISRERDFPIMTLEVDEMTGEAGYVTRIEAFLDLLQRRKESVLSRD